MHNRFRDCDTPACKRRKHLILDLPEGPSSRKKLAHVSPRVAIEYARKGEKTLTRDINALVTMQLLTKTRNGYQPNTELILAFLPPRVEKDRAADEIA